MSDQHRPAVPALSRRRTLAGAAGIGIAAPLLAACGSDSDTASDAGSGDAGTGGTGAGASTIAASDIPVGGGEILSDAGVVVTQPTAGEFKAFSSTCTHTGCQVGSVSDGKIICPCHGSQFSIADGSVLQGPAGSPLAEQSITVTKGEITLG